jgi:hypothetical protein
MTNQFEVIVLMLVALFPKLLHEMHASSGHYLLFCPIFCERLFKTTSSVRLVGQSTTRVRLHCYMAKGTAK